MKTVIEKFYLFIQSSFDENKRVGLFEYIWKNYSKKIYFYISKIIPLNHLYIDDIFQEIMIKIYKNLHTFNPIYSFKPWIYKITKNHCINFIKNKEEKISSSKATNYDIADVGDTGNPEKHFFQEQMVKDIDEFTNLLKPTDREIFYLRFYENLGYKNISQIMDMNINTVKSRVHLIKIELKNKLRGDQ